MSEPFIGAIALFAFDYPPRGWARCDGQTMRANMNPALCSLLGATYGGDGRTSFALPDLRGRAPVSSGQGPGLENLPLGASGGTETVALQISQIPSHTHQVRGSTTPGDSAEPYSTVYAKGGAYASRQSVLMNENAAAFAGTGVGHENRQPFQVLNYCIALTGTYPSQS